ncbi:MAG: 4-(cytidine 5'-diphospho)-2-C-methyl-D-erythritol kinase [Thiotrichales bacterium]|nr:4-(cytidine 5'-diphospho)-2-C-methyl-D-erythritol kinase [Thiotrichales bacterium]
MISRGWPAPAKINLFLHVTAQRADGYHLLQTVFQFLALADQIDFTIRDDGQVRRTSRSNEIKMADDLVVRAARALQEAGGKPLGADIHVEKHIPLQAGLGGGSSDAATTLLALNRLWKTGLSVDALAEIGVRLGADVPVFVRGQAAFAEGVGEQLTPVAPAEDWYVIIRPDCRISTAEIFQAPDLTRNTPPITIRDFLAGAGQNDCLPVVLKRFPQVAEAMNWLGNYSRAKMTGTGSTVFAPFADQASAETVLHEVPQNWSAWVAQGRNRSPLLDRLEQKE